MRVIDGIDGSFVFLVVLFLFLDVVVIATVFFVAYVAALEEFFVEVLQFLFVF